MTTAANTQAPRGHRARMAAIADVKLAAGPAALAALVPSVVVLPPVAAVLAVELSELDRVIPAAVERSGIDRVIPDAFTTGTEQ